MDPKIRDAIDRSLEQLKQVQGKVDEFIDDLPDDTSEIKNTAKSALSQISELLSTSMKQAGETAEEAQLQAHLGLMEAQDKLDASRDVVDDFIARGSRESKKLLDELELKQKLAMMEAMDFWEQRGPELTEEFKASTSNMQSIVEKAAVEMQNAFTQWNDTFKKDK